MRMVTPPIPFFFFSILFVLQKFFCVPLDFARRREKQPHISAGYRESFRNTNDGQAGILSYTALKTALPNAVIVVKTCDKTHQYLNFPEG